MKMSRNLQTKEKGLVPPQRKNTFNMERVLEMALVGPLDANNLVVKSELMKHQKEALGWMVYRENSSDLPPFWAVKDGFFVNELTDFMTKTRPDPIRGGIFRDDMGVGKTFSLISLIASDQCVNVDHINVMKKTTLVICPPSVLSTLDSELCKHTRSLKVYMYYGGERTDDPEELQFFDFGVDSRESVSPLCKIKWWRVILDDAHVLKSIDARETLAVMRFLRVNAFMYENCWNRMIHRPMSQKDPRGQSRLEVRGDVNHFFDGNKRGSCGEVIETCFVELSSTKLEIYVQAEEEAKTLVNSFNGDVQGNYSCVLSLVIRLRLHMNY